MSVIYPILELQQQKASLRRLGGATCLLVVLREVQLSPQLLVGKVAHEVAPPATHGRAPRARTRREHRQHPRGEVVRQVAQQGG